MKLSHLLSYLSGQPWMIEPRAMDQISQLIIARATDSDLREPATDVCGGKVERAGMEVVDGVAYIPIGGALAYRVPSPIAGVVDYREIQDEIHEAQEDDDVEAIVFEIDSPGGMVMGAFETARAIAAIDKHTVSFVDGLGCSAGYAIACSADRVFATSSAMVGSVGVVAGPYIDFSRALDQRGITARLFTSGKYKGAGSEFAPLTESQSRLIQDNVEKIHSEFREWVRSRRGEIKDSTMEGQCFDAMQGLDLGLVDVVVDSRREFESLFRASLS